MEYIFHNHFVRNEFKKRGEDCSMFDWNCERLSSAWETFREKSISCLDCMVEAQMAPYKNIDPQAMRMMAYRHY